MLHMLYNQLKNLIEPKGFVVLEECDATKKDPQTVEHFLTSVACVTTDFSSRFVPCTTVKHRDSAAACVVTLRAV